MLARFKPLINATDLIPSLSHMDRGSADALDYFKNTHHMLLYYEDLVSNHTVSSLPFLDRLMEFEMHVNTIASMSQTPIWFRVILFKPSNSYYFFLKMHTTNLYK